VGIPGSAADKPQTFCIWFLVLFLFLIKILDMMKPEEWQAMQAEAKAQVAQSQHERATVNTLIVLCEMLEQLAELNSQMRAKGR
jgi:hypothetical protein